MSIESVIARRNQAIAERPLLVVEMSPEEIDRLTFSFHGGSMYTEHQRAAARIAGKELQWHPRYALKVGAIDRPPLLWGGNQEKWLEQVANWERQHTLSVEELAQEFVVEFNRYGQRLLEPVMWSDELIGYEGEAPVKISAHDCEPCKRPCRASEW
jgi:hypothetical protein